MQGHIDLFSKRYRAKSVNNFYDILPHPVKSLKNLKFTFELPIADKMIIDIVKVYSYIYHHQTFINLYVTVGTRYSIKPVCF